MKETINKFTCDTCGKVAGKYLEGWVFVTEPKQVLDPAIKVWGKKAIYSGEFCSVDCFIEKIRTLK